ncbi:hypothetical protein DXV76_09610 [Rhodobacteraceae bacterium CCMM004]|nr:hypothetical protein DXV76_09610 [Rhodobacteraceae bacterium CCMM004]
MADEPTSLVLEQLRLIREDLRGVHSKMDDLAVKVDGHTALLIGLGKYVHDIDGRVEHIEQKLGIDP